MPRSDAPHRPAGTRLIQAGFLLLGLLTFNPALAETGAELYREANAAFRAGDFARAATLYRSADAAGCQDPRLFYNLGVAEYRQGRLDEAESAFMTASTRPGLTGLAFYNLGLVARRRNEIEEARGWFRQVVHEGTASARLKALSRKALAALGDVPRRTVSRRPPSVYQEPRPDWRDFISFSLDSGFGTDSNVYRTPADAYVDLAAAGTPTIDPQVSTGSYVPLTVDADVHWGLDKRGEVYLRYGMDGRIYTDAALSNANRFRNSVAVGGRAYKRTESGYRYFSSEFAAIRYDEDYYDRDDGLDESVSGADLSNRLRRTRFGPRFYYHRERWRLGYGLRGDAFISRYDEDYGDTLAYLDLTHEQYLLGAHVSLEPLKGTKMQLDYTRYQRRYAERLAKDATGALFTSNDTLEYDYSDYGLSLRQRFGRRWNTRLDYHYTDRVDRFESYDDYTRHTGRARARYRGRRLEADVGVTYRFYDFPNSFAFDQTAAGEKTLDAVYAELEVEYRFRPRYAVRLAAQLDLVSSSDPRIEYDRNQVSLALAWRL